MKQNTMNRNNGVLEALSRNLNAVEKIHFNLMGRWPGVLGAKAYKVGDEYSFTSYDTTGATEYGAGTVEITAIGDGYVTVEVLTNEPDESFVGMNFKMKESDVKSELIPLYNMENEPAGISVKIDKIEE